MLKWEVLPHLPYSPDIAPSDFHLFRSMAHGPTDQRFFLKGHVVFPTRNSYAARNVGKVDVVMGGSLN